MSKTFATKKRRILESLSQTDEAYTDLSPKGSVDEEIRDLVHDINSTEGFVTTSSCSGRVTLFLEGRRSPSEKILGSDDADGTTDVASVVGGKGGGGKWIFSSHQSLDISPLVSPRALLEHLGLPHDSKIAFPGPQDQVQYLHLKFEPMILHILSESPEKAQLALNAALAAGFRESGISSVVDSKGRPSNPIIAVRSSGLGMDSIIGFQSSTSENSGIQLMVSVTYLQTLVHVANERFAVNTERMERFREAFQQQIDRSAETSRLNGRPNDSAFEPADVRRQRMRKEGLERREAMLANHQADIQLDRNDNVELSDSLAYLDHDESPD